MLQHETGTVSLRWISRSFNTTMKPTSHTCLAVVLFLAGCAMPDPLRSYEPKATDAELVLVSVGMPTNVRYSISTSDARCDGFETVGEVRDSGRGAVMPWIANLTDKLNRTPTELRAMVPTGGPVQVKGYGHWFDGASKGWCGPLVAKFSTQPLGKYRVEFAWSGTQACSLRVFDVGDAAVVKPVPVPITSCSKPMF